MASGRIELDETQTKLVVALLENYWDSRNMQSPHEILGLATNHPNNPTEDWFDDAATELAEALEKEGHWQSGGR